MSCLQLRPVTNRKAVDVPIKDIIGLASTMDPPEDLMFVAREVGWRLDSDSSIRKEIAELQQR